MEIQKQGSLEDIGLPGSLSGYVAGSVFVLDSYFRNGGPSNQRQSQALTLKKGKPTVSAYSTIYIKVEIKVDGRVLIMSADTHLHLGCPIPLIWVLASRSPLC